MELVSEFNDHLQLTTPVSNQTNVVVFERSTLANNGALGHVLLHYVVLGQAFLPLPPLIHEALLVSIEAHANRLVTEEVALGECVAKVELELVGPQEVEALLG